MFSPSLSDRAVRWRRWSDVQMPAVTWLIGHGSAVVRGAVHGRDVVLARICNTNLPYARKTSTARERSPCAP